MRLPALLLFAMAAWAGDPPTILIAPFENLSGVRQTIDYEEAAVHSAAVVTSDGAQVAAEAKRVIRGDRLSGAPDSLLEDKVVNAGGEDEPPPQVRRPVNASKS